MNRRDFMVWTGALAAAWLLPGCEADGSPARRALTPGGRRANDPLPPPRGYARTPYIQPHAPVGVATVRPVRAMAPPAAPRAFAATPVPPPRSAPAVLAAASVAALPRGAWKADKANTSKMKIMDGVNRVTIHHEGNAKGNYDESPAQVAQTLRLIQKNHRARMGAGDIGYHFIIDRSGRIWQGREESYQGAHVSGANPHNVGVMLLGNFDIQKPTEPQIASLDRLTRRLMAGYNLRPNQLFCHRELGNTRCPGSAVSPQVVSLRQRMT